jgi:lysophospholipase L1-like esterase
MIEDEFAPSEVIGVGDKKLPVDDQTIRVTLTPTYGGSTLRIHLSNRFGTTPVTFTHVTVGRQRSGAMLTGPPVSLTFGGKRSVTVPAGRNVTSDPASLSFSAMQTLEVSVFVAGNGGLPTEHYTGRQTTYYTPDGVGDQSGDVAGTVFALQNSDRPYVDGVDVLAPKRAGAVVALGDSITDGYQAATAEGIPASIDGFDLNERWPDDLARRLIAAHIPLAVLNAGISGNRVLWAGTVGDGPDVYGPSALTRLKLDVLQQAGVTTVIWLEGINDIGQGPTASAAQIEAGYIKGIAEMHEAGLKVLQGTLIPAGGDPTVSYGGAAANTEREQINKWILSKSPADGVVNFSAAIEDPSDPSQMLSAYSGADHLHPDPAGYQAMANAIKLSSLRLAVCAQSPLQIRVSPGVASAYTRVILHLTVTDAGHPVPGANVTVDGRRTRTNRRGHALLTVRFARTGRFAIVAAATGDRPGSTTISVRR